MKGRLMAEEQRLLPREMVWLYPVAPLAAAPLLAEGLLSMPWKAALLQLGGVALPFAALSLAFHVLYLTVMPGSGRPRPSARRRCARSWTP